MNNRILELAKDHFYLGCPTQYDPMSFLGKLDFFYKAAHQDGQRQMRERAAKVVEQLPIMIDGTVWPESCAGVIRNLEITNE